MTAGTLDPMLAATLAALIRVHARDGRATIRSVAVEVGAPWRSTYDRLNRLQELDLCASSPNQQGTLRPTVRPIPIESAA